MASSRQNLAVAGTVEANNGDPRRLLVRRLLTSQGFEKSARMRDFLAYVCDRALNDPLAGICEQDIGCAVFGRQANYDTNLDNIVRVNASQLRKRLEAYFSSEGRAEPLVLELPKGHYTPIFRERSAPMGPPPADSALWKRPWLFWMPLALATVLAVICIVLASALAARRPSGVSSRTESAVMKALWSRVLRNGQTTDIVLADSSFGLAQDLMGKPVPLSEYIHPNIWLQAPGLDSRPDAQLAARLAARRRHTDMASVNAAGRILALAALPSGSAQGRVALCFARDFNLRQMKSENTILLGSQRTNPWVEMVENRMRFHFGFDMASRQARFENTKPLAGELPVYANDPATSYCRLAFLPNLSGTGSTLVISGTDPEGTETGAEFLTTDAGIAGLLQRLSARRSAQLPYFEALLKSARVGGATPECQIVAVRQIAAN